MKKISDLIGADPYPAEEPQAQADREREQVKPDYSVAPIAHPEEFNWVLTGSVLAVHPNQPHEVLFSALNHDLGRPYAYGSLTLDHNWMAQWELTHSNMSLNLVIKQLKKYTREHGWKFDGMLDKDGLPFSGEALKVAAAPGIGDINPGVKDWKNKEWADTEMWDQIDPVDFYGEQDYPDESNPNAPHVCSDCGEPLPNYNAWRLHVMRTHINPDRKPQIPRPVVDLDQVIPADFNGLVMDQTVMRQAANITKLAQSGRPDIPGPIPFIYDVEQDRIYVGQSGERHADIQGRFTPGGMVEGVYDPKGQVQIRTDTDMPYTIRHMIDLWYAMHPELEVKGLFLLVGDQKYKLANSASVGHKMRNLAATDPAVWSVYEALAAHSNVYIVGGAVRDVILSKVPSDIDLLVQGMDETALINALESLPGRLDYTGKSFGVYRYKEDGYEVEVSLPRVERSTGASHKAFDVETNPYLPLEDDLGRRDFTANAMAVNLTTGELVDPYGGAEDIRLGVLNTVTERSFEEDPLRILRALVAISRHGLVPSEKVGEEIRKYAANLANEPAERIQSEFDKLMAGEAPANAIRSAFSYEVIDHIVPELAPMRDFDQLSKYHANLLDEHTLQVLELTAQQTDDIDLRYAALFHDSGKVASQWIDDEGYGHYYYSRDEGKGMQHEEVSADLVRGWMSRMRYPNARIERVAHLVLNHMFASFNSATGAKKFIKNVGNDFVDDLLILRFADNGGKQVGNAKDFAVDMQRQFVARVRELREPTDRAHLAVNGRDLLEAGYPPSPLMKEVLSYLVDLTIEDASLNNKEALLEKALDAFPVQPKESNILDPIQDALDPDVFDHPEDEAPHLKSEIRDWARENVFKVMKEAGWPDPTDYLHLVLTGSLTTYQWADRSDFDISLFVDVEKFPDWVRADLIKLMIHHMDGTMVPGTTHPVQVFVVPPTIKPENLYKPGLRSAYDLDQEEWIVLPERERAIDVHSQWPEYITYAKMVEDKMRLLLKYDPPGAKVYWHQIHSQRRNDQLAGKGDYARSNITYKWLANRGVFDLISEVTGEYIA